jgi:acetylornithine deacetylase/succinyl-diaminopimelate desuccinylase-like protein
MPKVVGLAAAVAAIGTFSAVQAETPNRAQLQQAVTSSHAANVKRLQDWIALPTIAAEKRNTPQGAEYMRQLALDAGFQQATIVPTDGLPGVFATLDAGANDCVGVYFMYDVKQFDPAEWSSPPLEARIVDRPGEGKAVVGRGAVNQKGPESAFLAALHAFKASGRKLPVNLVLVAEGEEEIASPHFPQVIANPAVRRALAKCVGVFIPTAAQSATGAATITLGAKGAVELQLISSGEKSGRGPKNDIHSSLMASVDSPAWHLIKALNTLVGPDEHTPAIDGWFEHVKPLTARQKEIIADNVTKQNEAEVKKSLGIQRWAFNEDFLTSQQRLASQPTVNIQGLVGGYMGPGGKTVLPGRAEAKIDLRLVPDMTRDEAVAKLKAHLAKHGFGDIEVNVSGGYGPTQTEEGSVLIQAQKAALTNAGVQYALSARSAGSWPGVVFTGDPLRMAAGQIGIGRGSGAHAPNEWFLVESSNPKIAGLDEATMFYIDYLYQLAEAAGGSGSAQRGK